MPQILNGSRRVPKLLSSLGAEPNKSFHLTEKYVANCTAEVESKTKHQHATRQDAVSHIVVCTITSVMKASEVILTSFQKHKGSCHLGLFLMILLCLASHSFLKAAICYQAVEVFMANHCQIVFEIFNLLVTVLGLAFQQ